MFAGSVHGVVVQITMNVFGSFLTWNFA